MLHVNAKEGYDRENDTSRKISEFPGEFRVVLTSTLELIVFISARGKRIKAVS
jgi:hypothetical protein